MGRQRGHIPATLRRVGPRRTRVTHVQSAETAAPRAIDPARAQTRERFSPEPSGTYAIRRVPQQRNPQSTKMASTDRTRHLSAATTHQVGTSSLAATISRSLRLFWRAPVFVDRKFFWQPYEVPINAARIQVCTRHFVFIAVPVLPAGPASFSTCQASRRPGRRKTDSKSVSLLIRH